MTIILICIAFGLTIAFAFLLDKVNALRTSMDELGLFVADRVSHLERRLDRLEKVTGDLRFELATATQRTSSVSQVETGEPEVVLPTAVPSAPPRTVDSPHLQQPRTATQVAPSVAKAERSPIANTIRDGEEAQAAARTTPPIAGFQQSTQASTHIHSQSPAIVPESSKDPTHSTSLEERLGTNWLSKIGVAIVVIGVAYFLAPRLANMGPVGKALTALAVSLFFLLGGAWLEHKQNYRIFARAGIGGGWALLFFTTYALHHLDATRIVDSVVLDLVLMLLVAAGMVLHSLRYRSQTVTGLAFLLAFGTLATSHFEAASGTVVFSLLASAVLALGLVVVTTVRHWAWLELAGLAAVLGNHFLWLALVLSGLGGPKGFTLFWQSTALILFYWALFRTAYLLRVPLDEREDRISSLTAVVTSGGVMGLLKFQSSHPEWAFWALLAMGTVELALGIWARGRRRSAFVVLTTLGAVLLVTAVPFHFHGVSWPILWLVEAHVLALCGIRLGEPVFRRLGLIAGFGASLVLALHDLVPLAIWRLEKPDPLHHLSLVIGLALAAALFWLHGEVYPRRWPEVVDSAGELEQAALVSTSWLGLGAASAAVWVGLPAEWIAVGWLGLVIALGFAADWRAIVSLALQADVLAGFSVIALVGCDVTGNPPGMLKLPSGLAIVLFYCGMRRKTVLENAPAYVAPIYSWIASLLLLGWISAVVPQRLLIFATAGTALAFFEIGAHFRKGYLRWQGLAAAAFSFWILQAEWFDHVFQDIDYDNPQSQAGFNWARLLVVAALGYSLQERTRRGKSTPVERHAGIFFGAASTLILVWWIPSLLGTWRILDLPVIGWGFMATTLIAVALFARRGVFQIHGIAIALWTGIYGASFAFLTDQGTHQFWWNRRLSELGIAAALLLAGLVFAFPLRRICATSERWTSAPEFLKRPEQWFFFVPFGLIVGALAIELRSGDITLGWSILGLGTFVFALFVGERSFRLTGLALLLLSVAKIILMDVWLMRPTDKWVTLIATGSALMVVSFLYSRFRDAIRKLL